MVKGRDKLKERWQINEDSHWAKKYSLDPVYAGLLTLALKPIIYLASGETSLTKIVVGSFGVAGAAVFAGFPQMYTVDVFNDCVGTKPSERVPGWLAKRSDWVKKTAAAAFVAASLAYTTTIVWSNTR